MWRLPQNKYVRMRKCEGQASKPGKNSRLKSAHKYSGEISMACASELSGVSVTFGGGLMGPGRKKRGSRVCTMKHTRGLCRRTHRNLRVCPQTRRGGSRIQKEVHMPQKLQHSRKRMSGAEPRAYCRSGALRKRLG